jgi:hypothetical protein
MKFRLIVSRFFLCHYAMTRGELYPGFPTAKVQLFGDSTKYFSLKQVNKKTFFDLIFFKSFNLDFSK